MTTAQRDHAGFPRVGIGTGSLANAGGEGTFIATIRESWARGMRYFDTAALYLGGESERRLGVALEGLPRRELFLSTKIGRYQNHTGSSIDPQSKHSYFDYSAQATMRSVERSLERLKVDRLDAVYIHDLDHRIGGDGYAALFGKALREAYPALLRLKEQKVIGAVGIATMDWQACMEFAQAAEIDVVMPAGEYSLLRTKSMPLLELCEKRGIHWIAASPFNSGILATGARPDAFYHMRPANSAALAQVSLLQRICDRHGVPLAAAALQFPLRRAAVSTIVFGAKSVEELDVATSLCSLNIPDAFWTDMEEFLAVTSDWETPIVA